jgi:hypothetical protein
MLLMTLYKVQKLTVNVDHELTNILTKEGKQKLPFRITSLSCTSPLDANKIAPHP